jgi:hypothetical protein
MWHVERAASAPHPTTLNRAKVGAHPPVAAPQGFALLVVTTDSQAPPLNRDS